MFEFALIPSSVIVHSDDDVALDPCEMIVLDTLRRGTDKDTGRQRHMLSPQSPNA